MAPEIYVIRHGASLFNVEGKDDFDVDIHDIGKQQSEMMARGLKDELFSKISPSQRVLFLLSPLQRAKKTAYFPLMEALNCNISVDVRTCHYIREKMCRPCNVMNESEKMDESDDEVMKRIASFISFLKSDEVAKYDYVLAFSHHDYIHLLTNRRRSLRNCEVIKCSLS
jgi:broad specificity phosphatase PhoE